ncbi:hypothetical protein OPV22_015272 [Ensete ventricosum]|uniref:Uncharacterized protein n=1 Tax=Ensete ventricosum TaxID=4639 RepID=A0AAV8R7W0_ENSVE|nr:hypothetical protein OPV22_015272 [Ensete ventricosum]
MTPYNPPRCRSRPLQGRLIPSFSPLPSLGAWPVRACSPIGSKLALSGAPGFSPLADLRLCSRNCSEID